MYVRNQPQAADRAGFGGKPLLAGNKLFESFLNNPSGVIFAVSDYADSWRAVRLPGNRINLWLEELLPELTSLDTKLAGKDPDYPFILSAGERRSDTSNTSVRDPAWQKKGLFGTLRINPKDAEALGCASGDWVTLTTRRGNAEAPIEVTADLQEGHVSLPNGHGLDYHRTDGTMDRRGVSLNELTGTDDRDPIAGTPWHKYVPVKLARLATI